MQALMSVLSHRWSWLTEHFLVGKLIVAFRNRSHLGGCGYLGPMRHDGGE